MTLPPEVHVTVDALTAEHHDRDVAGLRYVYPVVSRRAGGVSIGINLNPNNACNWRCIYCQVPNLTRGRAPEIDLTLLESELNSLLEAITAGHLLEQHVATEHRVIKDFAFSGNGEPTSCPQFAEALEVVGRVRASSENLRHPPHHPHHQRLTRGSYERQGRDPTTCATRWHGVVQARSRNGRGIAPNQLHRDAPFTSSGTTRNGRTALPHLAPKLLVST